MFGCMELVEFYSYVMDLVGDKLVVFCMFDIGFDKVLFFMILMDEFNFVFGWCVICVGFDKLGVLWM